jgi:hypothetical protein
MIRVARSLLLGAAEMLVLKHGGVQAHFLGSAGGGLLVGRSCGNSALGSGTPFALCSAVPRIPSLSILAQELEDSGGLAMVSLCFGVGELAGRVWGVMRENPGGVVRGLDELVIVGSGMHRIPEGGAVGQRVEIGLDRSRLIGAPQGGVATLRRLQWLRVCVVGVGRLGSLIAEGLATMGVAAELIDPDLVESKDVSETPSLSPFDIGKFKAVAIADEINSRRGAALLTAHPVSALAAQGVLQRAEVVICAADHPAARDLCGLIANRYLAVLIDVGTGVLGGGARGFEVRLILPGEACLRCANAPGGEPHALPHQLSGQSTHRVFAEGQWAGSLPLNLQVAGLALQLLVDLVDERLQNGVWLRADTGTHGTHEVTRRPITVAPECRECRALCGLGSLATPGETAAWITRSPPQG